MPSAPGGRGPVPPPSIPGPVKDLPLSRPIQTDRVHAGEYVDVVIDASDAECAGVARLLGLKLVEQLHATLQLSRNGSAVRVTGSLRAAVVQTCVVTLEPVPAQVSDLVELRFAPLKEVEALEAEAARSGDPFIDVADAVNLPDPIVDGRIDLGEIVVEALVLALDPYPRKPGTTFGEQKFGDDVADVSPFAALRQLKPPE